MTADPLDPTTKPRRPKTLHERLAVEASRIRGHVHGCVGDRPYRAWLVVRRWSGGDIGRGVQVEASRVELRSGLDCHGRPVPPLIMVAGQYSRALHGLVEEGGVLLEELDPTYTEAELVAVGRLEPGDELLVELTEDGRDGEAPSRPVRRAALEGLPYRDAKRFQWVMRLRLQEPSAPFSGDGWLP